MAKHVIVLRRVEDFECAATGSTVTEIELTLEEFADLFEWGTLYEQFQPAQGAPYMKPRHVLSVREEAKARFR